MGILVELFQFLRARGKSFLWPIIMMMVLLGGLLVMAEGSVLAPMIYTLF